jgi:hypothetical protein
MAVADEHRVRKRMHCIYLYMHTYFTNTNPTKSKLYLQESKLLPLASSSQ